MGLKEERIQYFECDRCCNLIRKNIVQYNNPLEMKVCKEEFIQTKEDRLTVTMNYGKGKYLVDGILCNKCKAIMLTKLLEGIKQRIKNGIFYVLYLLYILFTQ